MYKVQRDNWEYLRFFADWDDLITYAVFNEQSSNDYVEFFFYILSITPLSSTSVKTIRLEIVIEKGLT